MAKTATKTKKKAIRCESSVTNHASHMTTCEARVHGEKIRIIFQQTHTRSFTECEGQLVVAITYPFSATIYLYGDKAIEFSKVLPLQDVPKKAGKK